MKDGLGSAQAQKPPEVTGTFTAGQPSMQRWIIQCHQLRESLPQLQPEGGFALQRVHEHKEIPLAPGERECSQDRLYQVIFLRLGFSHFGNKSLFLIHLEKIHSTKLWCIFVLLWLFLLSWGSQHGPAALEGTWPYGIHGGCQGSCRKESSATGISYVWCVVRFSPSRHLSPTQPLAHSHTVEHGWEWEE